MTTRALSLANPVIQMARPTPASGVGHRSYGVLTPNGPNRHRGHCPRSPRVLLYQGPLRRWLWRGSQRQRSDRMKAIVWLAVVGVIFTAAPAAAQEYDGDDLGSGRRFAGTGPSRRDRDRNVTKPSGHSRDGDLGKRRLHPHAVAVRPVSPGVRSRWIPARRANCRPRAHADAAAAESRWASPALTETVQVVARAADVLTQTSQVATNFSRS